MLQRAKQKGSKVILIIVILLMWGAMQVQVRDSEVIAQHPFSPIEKYKPEGPFVDFMATQFYKSIYSKDMNYGYTVSVVAIPAKKLLSVSDLDKGAIVGGLYLSSGSLKFGLPPGTYAVYVQRKGDQFWAEFRDDTGSKANTVPARVILGGSIKEITASVDYSVCYRINGGTVCV